jgi:hypothetical protein
MPNLQNNDELIPHSPFRTPNSRNVCCLSQSLRSLFNGCANFAGNKYRLNMHKTILAFAIQLALCASLFSQQQYYSVKFPDDRTVVGCGASADTSDWPIITYFSNCNFNVGVSVKDQVFNLNATGGCKKILRTWKLVYWCDYDPNWPGPTYIPNPGNTDVGPTVIANSLNHGFLEYTQVIKVTDNQAPVFLNCPDAPVLFCDYTNNDPAQYGNRCEGPVNLNVKVTDLCSKSDIVMTYLLYLDLDGNGSMETFQSSSAPGAWPIETTVTGDTLSAKIKLPAGVGLPYGTHKVEWIAKDNCGNQSICKYDFIVKDCKAPTVVCINGLSVNIMPTGMITFWATDFVKSVEDNCTPNNLLKIAIRKAGTGSGFPAFNTSVTFDCNEIGQQFVEIWAEDACGNADFCQTYIIVQDNIGACTPPGPVSGKIATEAQTPLSKVHVLLKNNLKPTAPQFNTASDALGNYWFAGAPGTCNYSIIPTLDTLPLLGLNTLDVMLSDWHISGQQLLPSPYKIIAADVNHDGQLNAGDLNAMSDLIVGAASNFPNNTAWRFVPDAFAFPNPANPLAANFPEKISTTCPVPSGLNHNFVAIKTGDVDASANLSTFAAPSDDRSAGDDKIANFRVVNRRFEAGQDVKATIIAPDLSTMLGFQFTVFANQDLLELQSVESLLSQRMAAYPGQNNVALSWYTKPGENTGERQVLTLHFKALQNGTLKQALKFTSAVAKAEAYDLEQKPLGVALQFVHTAVAVNIDYPKLMPISPNPATGPVVAKFFIPENGNANLSLSDVNGAQVSQHNAYFEAGWHQVEMPVGNRVSGLYFLRLQTETGSETQRVMLQR